MKVLEKFPTRLDLLASSSHQTELAARWRYSKGVLRFALSAVIAGAVLCTPVASRLMQITDLRAIRWPPRSIQMQWMR